MLSEWGSASSRVTSSAVLHSTVRRGQERVKEGIGAFPGSRQRRGCSLTGAGEQVPAAQQAVAGGSH